MSPEVQHHEELKWVLRNIKKELLHAGDIVDFNASRLTNSDPDSPTLDAIYKHLKDIERATVIRIVERYDGDGYDVYGYSLDAGAGVTGYKFIVDRDKFQTFYHAMVEIKVHMKDLSSDDAVDFDEERDRIGAITDKGEQNIELTKWRWFKNVLDQIYVQLSPIASHGQTVRRIDISKIPENISRNVLDDLWERGICEYAGGAQTPDWERFYYRQGTLILVKNFDRFQAYRDRVTEFVRWIDADALKKFNAPDKATSTTEATSGSNIIGQVEAIKKNLDAGLKEEALINKVIEKMKGGEGNDLAASPDPLPAGSVSNRKPCTGVDHGIGYFKFYKEGERIEIGGAATRPFLLIQYLCNPFGAWKAILEVFAACRLPSDDQNPKLKDWLPDKQDKMKQIIKNSGIKELQKIKQLQGELSYEWGSNETKAADQTHQKLEEQRGVFQS